MSGVVLKQISTNASNLTNNVGANNKKSWRQVPTNFSMRKIGSGREKQLLINRLAIESEVVQRKRLGVNCKWLEWL